MSFANLLLLDSVTRSSFGLDQDFASVTDILRFLPNLTLHYFFGPFPWEIKNLMQLVSFFGDAFGLPFGSADVDWNQKVLLRVALSDGVATRFRLNFRIGAGTRD